MNKQYRSIWLRIDGLTEQYSNQINNGSVVSLHSILFEIVDHAQAIYSLFLELEGLDILGFSLLPRWVLILLLLGEQETRKRNW